MTYNFLISKANSKLFSAFNKKGLKREMIKSEHPALALEYFDRAYKMQLDGEIENAINEYKASLRIFPTAKAHTFLGWAYSHQGKFEFAIDECKKAIELDPGCISAYNDIGTYLANLKRYDEAIEWLQKAVKIPEDSSKHISYFNIGNIYEHMGDWMTASRFYNKALLLQQEYEPAQGALIRMSTLLN